MSTTSSYKIKNPCRPHSVSDKSDLSLVCVPSDSRGRATRSLSPQPRSANAYTSTSQSGRHTPSSLLLLSSTHAKPARSAAASIAPQSHLEPRRSRGSNVSSRRASGWFGSSRAAAEVKRARKLAAV